VYSFTSSSRLPCTVGSLRDPMMIINWSIIILLRFWIYLYSLFPQYLLVTPALQNN